MPYSSKKELPSAVKELPTHAQSIFKSAFNAAFAQYEGDEDKAFATAWAAVKHKYGKGADGAWHALTESADDLQSISIHEALPVAGTVTLAPDQHSAEIEFITPGPGNKRDGNYYTAAAVKDIARLIKGRPMYVNHAAPEDRARGHRDVRMKASIVRESWYAPESSAARGRVTFLPTHPWLPATLAAEPDAVGVSIDAVGYGRPGEVEGQRYKAVIDKVVAVESADWVPEAAARGRFMRFVEAAGSSLSPEEERQMLEDMTAQELREANPALYDAVVAAARPEQDEEKGGMDEAAVRTMIQEATAPLAEENAALRAENERIAREHNRTQTQAYVVARLREADALSPAAADYVARRFEEATVGPSGFYQSREELDRALDAEVTAYRETLTPAGRRGIPTGMGGYGYVPPQQELREGRTAQSASRTDPGEMTALNDVFGSLFGVEATPAGSDV